MEHRGKKDWR